MKKDNNTYTKRHTQEDKTRIIIIVMKRNKNNKNNDKNLG